MKTIEEITFKVNGQKISYKLYEYEEETVRKIKKPAEIGEVTLHMGYKYVDTKIIVTKYALHEESEKNGNFYERLLCETEEYKTILIVIKSILKKYIKDINKFI